MVITEKTENQDIILSVHGRVDTTTSPELQQYIINTFKKTSYIILDFQQVIYVSSAGLRALLIGHKTALSKGGYMKLRNINDSVKEVLRMTGFASLLTLE